MNTLNKANFYILTGGPGAGKTSLLEEFKRRGYLTVPEVARNIIREQQASGGDATHLGNRGMYCDLMLQASIKDYRDRLTISDQAVFFDRGIPDLYSYSKRFCGGLHPGVLEAVNQYRYNLQVILFPPWEAIYCHDAERKQDFQEAVATHQALEKGYRECGYQLIHLPKDTVSARVDFILHQLSGVDADETQTS